MPQNYILLERIELASAAASVVFNNIPQSGYTDLKLVVSARSSQTDFAVTDVYAYFNGVNTNQTQRNLRGYGGSSGTVASQTRTDVLVGNMPSAVNTTNTFSNAEMYIPNYTASTSKSISIDAVSESNNTGTGFDWWVNLGANLWSSNSAITAITLVPSGGFSFVANSTFSLYGLAAVGTTPVIAPKATGGNLIESDGTYWIHTFYSTGTFTPLTGLSCDYLVVAGGGAGSSVFGGGGGAGGLLTGSGLSVAAQAYTVTVGAGGAGQAWNADVNGNNGSNSVFSSITATGGGGGGKNYGVAGNAGGSGGGGGGTLSGSSSGGAASPSGQGNAGGTGNINPLGSHVGGGGGGAGAVGGAGNATGNSSAGIGGAGTASSISGTSVTYAGGGGGGARSTGGTATPGGAGGTGGGGTGGGSQNGSVPTSGTANRGSGGGGYGYSDTSNSGNAGSGGSGIVIIRYPIA